MLAASASSRRWSGSSSPRRIGLSPSFTVYLDSMLSLLSLSLCVFVFSLCEWCCPLCVCVVCPLSRSLGRRQGGLAQILLSGWQPKVLTCPPGSTFFTYLLQYTFCHYDCIYNLYTTIFCCESLLYSIHVCPFWERDPSSVAHPETSSVFGGKFFLLWNKTLRTDGVVFCTDCTDPWGKSRFMIWGYVKKIDLHWLDSGLESNWSSFPWNPRGIAITFMIWHICG